LSVVIQEPRSGEYVPSLVLVTGLPGTGKSSVASAVSEDLQAPVLAHDWAMSALRVYPQIQNVLNEMEPSGHRVVGWSILTRLAQSQLRAGRSVVLDGVARPPEIAQCQEIATTEGGSFILISTRCSDPEIHRARVDGRQRNIPDWYELTWDQVERSRASWIEPAEADLILDAIDPWEENRRKVGQLVSSKLIQVNETPTGH
jgi:predicted kinase